MGFDTVAFLAAVVALAGCSSSSDTNRSTSDPVRCELLCETDVACHGGEDPEGALASCVQWCEAQSADPQCQAQWTSFARCVQSVEEDFACASDEGSTLLSVPDCERQTAEYEACGWFATAFCTQMCEGVDVACSVEAQGQCLLSCYEQAAECLLGGQFTRFEYSCESSSVGGGGFTCETVAGISG